MSFNSWLTWQKFFSVVSRLRFFLLQIGRKKKKKKQSVLLFSPYFREEMCSHLYLDVYHLVIMVAHSMDVWVVLFIKTRNWKSEGRVLISVWFVIFTYTQRYFRRGEYIETEVHALHFDFSLRAVSH